VRRQCTYTRVHTNHLKYPNFHCSLRTHLVPVFYIGVRMFRHLDFPVSIIELDHLLALGAVAAVLEDDYRVEDERCRHINCPEADHRRRGRSRAVRPTPRVRSSTLFPYGRRWLRSSVGSDQLRRRTPANRARSIGLASCRPRARDEDGKIGHSLSVPQGTSSAFSPNCVISYPPVSRSLTMQPLISPSSLV